MSKRLHVKYPLIVSILVKFEFSRQIFEKLSNIKFNKNPSSGSRVVPCGQMDMTKLIVAFRNFANAPKNVSSTRALLNYTSMYPQHLQQTPLHCARTVCLSAPYSSCYAQRSSL